MIIKRVPSLPPAKKLEDEETKKNGRERKIECNDAIWDLCVPDAIGLCFRITVYYILEFLSIATYNSWDVKLYNYIGILNYVQTNLKVIT